MMEASEQIELFKEFFEQVYLQELQEQLRKGENYLNIDFLELSKFNLELAEQLLEGPEDTLKAAEIATEHFNIEYHNPYFRARFFNLPPSQQIFIKDIRSTHINKIIQTRGLIRQKSDVRPQVTNAKFECPSCGGLINVLQLEAQFKEPSQCSCGRKGKFRLVNKELVDAQKIVLEEIPEDLDGNEQPRRLNLFLKNDLVSSFNDKRTNPGTKIVITGIIKEVPMLLPHGMKSTKYDICVETNHILPEQEDFIELQISPEEEQEILKLSTDNKLCEKLVSSIAPSVYGHEKIKEALILQLFGGVKKVRDKGDVTRGDLHILLIGDPGAGKSILLRKICSIAPKSRYVSGKGASGTGLTAAVVKDDFIKGWALEAGAMVLANKGLCAIDELDKMSVEDQSAMHECLEQQTVTITKANIQATLRAETTLLAAANPQFGRFDPYEEVAKQINLPSTLLNRFDLIFPIKDCVDETKDELMAEFVLRLHQGDKKFEGEIRSGLIKKYVAYAKQKVTPHIDEEALQEIKSFYVKMRKKGNEGGIPTIPITTRQLEALVRLSEASARMRLSIKVSKEDARRAISLVCHCLAQIGIDPETGKIDIDRITTGVSANQRDKISLIKTLIRELKAKEGIALYENIESLWTEKGHSKDQLEEYLGKMNQEGVTYSPRPGRYDLLGG